ncbi:MAG: BolA family transcriptional regulator [Gammaproteobacteria bacterium]|nr:BolA family transcriptional regulator [Gammaproteobacteria bacterium]MBL6998528.1 BolA family transcriptional regulator [Gammaproteobacteria bacterium]
MTPQIIQQLIEQCMPEAQVTVSGAEGKFSAEVISPQFEGLMTIKRHKLVYACVHAEITSGALHALTIVTKTPAEAA